MSFHHVPSVSCCEPSLPHLDAFLCALSYCSESCLREKVQLRQLFWEDNSINTASQTACDSSDLFSDHAVSFMCPSTCAHQPECLIWPESLFLRNVSVCGGSDQSRRFSQTRLIRALSEASNTHLQACMEFIILLVCFTRRERSIVLFPALFNLS